MQLFISYSRKDSAQIEELSRVLHGLGHSVWFDREISGGEVWWNAILSAIENCDVVIFALSPDSTNSQACLAEIDYSQKLNKAILPLMIREVKVETHRLRSYQIVNATDLSKRQPALDIAKGLSVIDSRIEEGEFKKPDPLPERPLFPFPPDPLSPIREKLQFIKMLTPGDLINIVYEIKQVARDGEKVQTEARELLKIIISNPNTPKGVLDEAYEVERLIRRKRRHYLRYALAGSLITLIGIAVLILLMRRDLTLELGTPAPTQSPNPTILSRVTNTTTPTMTQFSVTDTQIVITDTLQSLQLTTSSLSVSGEEVPTVIRTRAVEAELECRIRPPRGLRPSPPEQQIKIYRAPDSTSDQLGVVGDGNGTTVIGMHYDDQNQIWWIVILNANGLRGWVIESLVDESPGCFSLLSTTPTPVPSPQVVIMVARASLYLEPNSSNSIDFAYRDQSFQVTGKCGDWFQITRPEAPAIPVWIFYNGNNMILNLDVEALIEICPS